MSDEIQSWVLKAREVEVHKAGNADALIEWYNNGADGQINWGSEGDFDACVTIAGKHLDNPEGFCQLRHIDATGEPTGKAPNEITKGDVEGHVFHGNQWVGGNLSKYPLTGGAFGGEFGTFNDVLYNRNLDKAKQQGAETTCAHCAKIVNPENAWLVRGIKGRAGELLRSDKFFDHDTPEAQAGNGSWRLIGDTCGAKQCGSAYRVRYSQIPESVRPPIGEIEPAAGAWNYDFQRVYKGDLPDHEFHGNQYTGGIGGGTATSTETEPKEDRVPTNAREIAQLLADRARKNEPAISKEIEETCKQYGGVRIKPEFVLKDEASIARKLELDSKEYLDTKIGSLKDAAENLGDTVRFTIQFPNDKFGDGVTKSLADFKTEGFEALKVKNFFNDDPQNSYRGINCVFRDSTTNQKFEVQFHTEESQSMVGEIHPVYEEVRKLDPSSQEYADGQAKMISMWQSIPMPAGVEGIGKISVKKSAQVLYFYDFMHPEFGATGTATLENGKFTTYTGDGEFWVSNERRLVKAVLNQDTTDQEIYDSLNGWSDGKNFCVDAPKTWTV